MTPTARRIVAATAVILAVAMAVQASATPRTAVPPPTPVPPRGSPSPFPTSLATPTDATREPTIGGRAAIVADLDTGQVLAATDAGAARPIASITKIMTALLTLEALPLDETVRVDPAAIFERDDFGASATLGLLPGERISVENLLYALLLGSANDAALALAIAVDGSEVAFVRAMNARARELGMTRTHFASASGLDDRGVSTARDLLRLVRAADTWDEFGIITATKVRRIPAPRGSDRIIQNRNALLWLYRGADGTKTGTTAGAGACVVASAARGGRRLVAIVLGASGEPFSDAAALLDYGFDGWEPATLTEAGDPAGTADLRGGSVPVVTGAGLDALVPVHGADVVAKTVIDPRAAFPPAPGERVGTQVFRRGSQVLGHVPLVVSSVPPPAATSGPWWLRAAEAVGSGIADAVGGLAA